MQCQGRPVTRLDVVVRTLFLSFCLAWPACVSAQLESMRFEHLTINDGLSQSSVNALAQDRRGYLWVGTQDGLNRYDGYRFDVMRYDPDDPRSLANNNITTIFEDRAGILWVGTNDGTVHRYDRDSNDFERFRITGSRRDAGSADTSLDVHEICETSDGKFWIGTDLQGIFLFDNGLGTFEPLTTVREQSINVLKEVQSNELWVGSSQGLRRYLSKGGTLIPLDADNASLLDEDVRTIEVLRSGQVWAAGSNSVISRFTPDGALLGRITVRSTERGSRYSIRSILQDSASRIWVGLIGGGLKVLTDNGETIVDVVHSTSDPYSLPTSTAYSLLEDKSGVLWVGSLEAGLSRSVAGAASFTHFRHVPGDPSSLSDNMVIEFAEDENNGVWVGSSGGGLSYLAPNSSRFIHHRADPADPSSLSSDRIWGMYLEPGGVLWVGTWGGGLNRFETATASVQRFMPNDSPGALPGAIVTAIVGDGAGGLYAGLVDGGLVHRAAGGTGFRRLALFNAGDELTRPVNIAALYYDSKDRLWAGTWSRGLCVAARKDENFRCHAHDPTDRHTINNNNIRAINEDLDGGIWIATGGGIARYDEESGEFERFTSSEGLIPGVIYAVVPEQSGVLWLSSNRGLMRYDVHQREGRHYEYKDGLQANEFNGGAALRTRAGQIYFGGVGGITRFDPSDLVGNPLPPEVVITNFSLFNSPVAFSRNDPASILKKPISETTSLELRYDQNFIGFEFSALHFVSPERNRYAYLLEGLDHRWTETDARRRFASYANVDPGDYVFRVRAANSDGVWSVNDAAIGIHIAPPWWLTWWAKSLLALITAMSLLLFVQWRLRVLRVHARQLADEVRKRTAKIVAQKDTIERQAAHLEDALESKSRFFARLSHEFRTPITLILGPIDESLREAIPDAAKRSLALAKRNGQRLLHLVDQLLTLARHGGQQHVERLPIALAPVARLIVAEFNSAAAQKGIEITLDVVDDVWVESNADALQTILVNLVSNALKYTEAGGSIAVSVAREGGDAVMRVADSGVGIAAKHLGGVFNLFERGPATGPGTGIGLTLVKELIDAHEGIIGIDSIPGTGTTVTVRLKSVVPQAGTTPSTLIPPDLDAEIYMQGPSLRDTPTPDTDRDLAEILIIDDNDDMRLFIVELLQEDYRCIEAHDGTTGLAQAIERIPDAVICDVMMPGLDGFEVLQRLRSDEHTSHVPIVMLTARGDEASRLKGLRERADDYLAKPFLPDELRYRLRNLLELCQLRAERARQQLLAGDGHGAAEISGLTKRDQAFLDRLGRVLNERYANSEFHANDLADAMHMSHRQLQRKLKALLDVAPAMYLRDFRLQKAKAKLEEGDTVTNAALDCGFSTAGYFARCFSTRYGIRPSDITKT